MKQFLLLFLFILVFIKSAEAQIVSGTKLSSNIAAKDINGNDVDIYADLAAGKTVFLDIFATWCSPCWSFHQTHILEELHQEFGPDGTDQIRVYAIEGDNTTPLSDISQASSSSVGNWLDGISYSVINNHNFNTILKIEAFPSLYVIRPDKTVFNIFGNHFNKSVWESAILPTVEKDLILPTAIADKNFCAITSYPGKPKIINMGTTPISSIDATLSINGVETLISVNKTLGVFESSELNFGTKSVTETTEFIVSIDAIDGVEDKIDDISQLKTTYYRPVVSENSITVKFTTDFYPSEISWNLSDEKNNVLFTQPNYKAGNEDQYGGGGEDANREFTYTIPVEKTNIKCLTLLITDSFGDGMTAFNSTHPIPGVEFYNSKGELIKPKLTSDFNFRSSTADTPSSTKAYAAVDFSSSLSDEEFVENLNVFPNPVNDILNINMTIKADTEYEVFVTDIMGASVTSINKNTNFLNVSNLTSGMYFLNVRTKDGIFTHKFTKI